MRADFSSDCFGVALAAAKTRGAKLSSSKFAWPQMSSRILSLIPIPPDARLVAHPLIRLTVACRKSLLNGVASFDLVRHHRANDSVFLYAFDLIELNGDDLRRDPERPKN